MGALQRSSPDAKSVRRVIETSADARPDAPCYKLTAQILRMARSIRQ